MLRSLYSGASGLQAHQVRMDVVANNIANVNTAGYKKSRVTFQDTLSQTLKEATEPDATGKFGGTNPFQIGSGVTVGSINTIYNQGATSTTGNATDVMIQGEGYFILKHGTDFYYTRAGAFTFDKNGDLVNSSNGMYVLDINGNKINIPNITDVKNINITSTGEVKYIDSGGTAQTAGIIGLATFHPSALKKVGQSLYIEDGAGGIATTIDAPGVNPRGVLISGALEMSNVDLTEEFTDMIISQRGFQANARTVRVSDEILQELINIKR